MGDTIVGVDGTAAADGFLTWWSGHSRADARIARRPPRRRAGPRIDRGWRACWSWRRRALRRPCSRIRDATSRCGTCTCTRCESTPEGTLVDGRRPLRWLDLPGFRPDRPHQLSAGASRVRISRSPALRELCLHLRAGARAGRMVGRRSPPGHRPAAGRRARLRRRPGRAARARGSARRALRRSVRCGRGGRARVRGLARRPGARRRRTRRQPLRVLPRRARASRRDARLPDLDGPDGADYVEWCWVFGREEVSIPDRFMPPQPGSAAARHERRRPRDRSDLRAERVPAGGGRADAGERDCRAGHRPASESPSASPVHPQNGSQPAVRVTGYLSHTLGLGAAGRGYAQALQAAGVAVSTASVPLHHLELPVELQDGYGRHGFEDVVHDEASTHGFEIVAVNADELPSFVARLGEDYFQGPRIGIWGWETDTIPARWQRAFALVQEIWVYSRFMAQNIGAVAPVPTIALPPPVQRARRARCAAAPGRARRRLPVPVRVRLPEHDPAQEPGRPDRGVQARVRARRGAAAAAEDDQRAAAPAGRGGGAVGRPRAPRHPRDRPLAQRRRAERADGRVRLPMSRCTAPRASG